MVALSFCCLLGLGCPKQAFAKIATPRTFLIIQARHATSQHSGTPVTNIHSPTQGMGDALVALRPPQLLNYAQNPAQLSLPQMAGRLFGMQFLPPSRATAENPRNGALAK
ncbi:hypothetical protein BJAS_P2250 [Bathymodiolus japonicus methanotrophic gill symbiont]|nr:hypothetical protein BJAS_P2250 [Bathymodiolus japonicus methanotrophic gill symbiont]